MSTRPRADSGAAWTNGIPHVVLFEPQAHVVLVHGQRPERIPFVDEEE